MPRDVLPQSVLGRIALGLLSAIFIPLSVLLLHGLAVAPAAANWGMELVHILMWELFAGLLAGSICGLIWAVAMPRWIQRLADQLSRRLTLLLLFPFAIIWCVCLFAK